MPRYNKEVREIAEKNRDSMIKMPMFELWKRKHLKVLDRQDEYRKAYDLVHKGEQDEQEDI